MRPVSSASASATGTVAVIDADMQHDETLLPKMLAAIEAQNWQRVTSREVSSKALGELKTKGMIYNDIPPAELAKMRADVRPVYDKFAAAYDPAVVTLFRSELERVSKF